MRNIGFKELENLSNDHGDSFYLLESNKFSQNYKEFLGAFQSYYPKTNIGYSYKTNYTPYLCKLVDDLDGFAEVVSDMEYNIALKIGVNPKNIIVNGPYKTKKALIQYFNSGCLVNIDSYYEVELIKAILNEYPNLNIRIGLRCNFELTEKYTSRFGFDVESDEFFTVFNELNANNSINIEGIHCHFPDRILDLYPKRAKKMLELCDKLFRTPPKFIDVGGGYYGKMPKELSSQFASPLANYQEYAKVIAGAFAEHFKNIDPSIQPMLITEPGSAVVADTLKFVTRVIDIKNVRGKFIATTAGSKFNMGSFSSTINMPMQVFTNNESKDIYSTIDVAGFTCIESDYLFKDYKGKINKGDFLVFENVGSYSIVFKPPFILPNVPIINISGNNEVIKRQETFEDIFATYKF